MNAWSGSPVMGAPMCATDAYVEASVTVGLDIAWEPDGTGTAVGVDEAGGLVVHTVGGRVVLRAGEVHHLRPGDGTTLAPGPAGEQESGTT